MYTHIRIYPYTLTYGILRRGLRFNEQVLPDTRASQKKVFSCYRMCSVAIECVLLHEDNNMYWQTLAQVRRMCSCCRMCSVAIECVLLHEDNNMYWQTIPYVNVCTCFARITFMSRSLSSSGQSFSSSSTPSAKLKSACTCMYVCTFKSSSEHQS